MSLIVEDGTGLSTAESYISVANATTYHSNNGNTAWAALASDTIREQCLRRATIFMTQQYRLDWKGYRTLNTQALDWPRYQVRRADGPALGNGYGGWVTYYDPAVIPTEVANACAELALLASSQDLNPAQTQNVTRKTIGPITLEYDQFSPQQKRYRSVDMMLAPFLEFMGANMKLTRS